MISTQTIANAGILENIREVSFRICRPDKCIESKPNARAIDIFDECQVRLTREDEEVEQGGSLLPNDATDVNGQQIDLRRINSWLLKVDQVSTSEVASRFLNFVSSSHETCSLLMLLTNSALHSSWK